MKLSEQAATYESTPFEIVWSSALDNHESWGIADLIYPMQEHGPVLRDRWAQHFDPIWSFQLEKVLDHLAVAVDQRGAHSEESAKAILQAFPIRLIRTLRNCCPCYSFINAQLLLQMAFAQNQYDAIWSPVQSPISFVTLSLY